MKCKRKSESGIRESTQTLAATVDCGNWVVVRDLLCDEDVDVAEVERCLVLHKLASTSNISLSLVEGIIDKIIKILSRDVAINMTDNNGDKAVIVAARCENWKVVWLLMSRQGALPDKDRLIAFLRIVSRSEFMNKNCGLSVNILGCLWDNLKKMIPEGHRKDIHDVLIHVAAKVNCWGLVRDLLTSDIDLNTLDEDGMGVVHRLANSDTDSHVSLLLRVLKNGGDIDLKNVQGDTPTHVAFKNSNWRMVKALLLQGASVDIVNNDHHTVLHLSVLCRYSVDEVFSFFKKSCLKIDARDSKGNTALQLAVKEGNNLVAEKLLTLGARSDLLDENGRTVLHSLVMHQNAVYSSSLLKKAIESGPSLATKDTKGNTAVHVAAKLKKWDYVNQLLAHGASAMEPDSEGWTVIDRILTSKTLPSDFYQTRFFERLSLNQQLHLTVSLRQWNFLEELVKNGVNLNSPDRLGFTVLQKLVQLQSDNKLDSVFEFLVKRGADITVRTPAGDNLVQLAAKHKNWLIVKRLLKQRFTVDEPDSEGFCVFHRLADYHWSLSRLLPRSVTTSARTPNGDTLLQLAAKNRNIPLVEYLVREGNVANINQLDSEGFSVIHRIVQCDSRYNASYVSLVNLLLSVGANPHLRDSAGNTSLHLAAKHNNWNIVKCLLEHGCELNEPDSEGFYILHRLAQVPHLNDGDSHFRRLVNKGADVSVKCSTGDSVLHLAAKHNNWMLVQLLAETGCDINKLDSEGLNILHRFVQTAHVIHISYYSSESTLDCLFRTLVNKGADVSARCGTGDTALHLAAKHNNWNIVERLIEQGGDISQPDSEGFYILHRLAQKDLSLKLTNWHKSTKRSLDYLFSMLLNKGACPFVRNQSGDTVLHVAAKYKNWVVVSHLIDQKVNINKLDSEGYPLLQRLVEPDSDGITILQRLAINSKRSEGNISLLQFLLDNGARCDTLCPSGDSAMHLAVKHGNWYIIEELLRDKIEAQSVSTATNEQSVSRSKFIHFMEKSGDRKRAHGSEIVRKQSRRVPVNIDTKDVFGNTILHLSAKAKNWNQVLTLLKCGADTSLTDDESHTVLYRLVTDNYQQFMSSIVEILRRRFIHTGEIDEFGNTLIQVAAINNNVKVVDMLLDHLDDVNMRDKDGLTILHRVVQCMLPVSLNIVKTLIKRKADIEIPGPQGDTALHLAAQCGNWDVVQELLENGARADSIDSKGMSILRRLVLFRFNSSERKLLLVKLMVNRGHDVNIKDKNGLTAVDSHRIGWEVVQFLLESGAEVGQKVQPERLSFLHRLARDVSVDAETARSVTAQLLKRGFNLNETRGHETLLYVAANYGNWTVVQVFLEHGADASIPDSEGWYVSHRLCKNNNDLYPSGKRLSSILLLLKSSGFQVNQTGRDGKSCVQMSIECKNFEIFWWLVEHGVEYSLDFNEMETIIKNMYLFIKENTDQNKVRTLIMHLTNKETSCQEITKWPNKALKTSVLFSKWVVAKALVECGAKVEEHLESQPLIHFLISKYKQSDHETWLSFLDALLARGADINCRDKAGRTILFQRWNDLIALYDEDGSDSLFHALVDRGASPLLADAEGMSLLRYVLNLEESLAVTSVKFLIQLGVSTHQPALTEAVSSRSPLQQAFEKRYVRAFKMLVESGAGSDRELLDLNIRSQIQLSYRVKTKLERQMLDILKYAASQPRSLKSLCRLTVSHALGCGPHRMDRVKSLPLTDALHDYILFSDLLSIESPASEEETGDLFSEESESDLLSTELPSSSEETEDLYSEGRESDLLSTELPSSPKETDDLYSEGSESDLFSTELPSSSEETDDLYSHGSEYDLRFAKLPSSPEETDDLYTEGSESDLLPAELPSSPEETENLYSQRTESHSHFSPMYFVPGVGYIDRRDLSPSYFYGYDTDDDGWDSCHFYGHDADGNEVWY